METYTFISMEHHIVLASASQTLKCLRIKCLYFVKNIDSDSVSLKWNLKFYICNKVPGETDAAGSRTPF